jgi:glycosyltransferase involved in cell wall biosynthesis
VLFDAYPHTYGGAQRTDHLLARALPGRGWDLVTCTPGEGVFTERLLADGLPVVVLATPGPLGQYGRVTTGWRRGLALPFLPLYWLRVLRRLRRERPAVVHIVDHRALVLAGPPARLSGARVIWHVQALEGTRVINRLGARLAHTVLVPSLAVVAKLPGIDGATDIRSVPNVVPDHARRAAPVPLVTEPALVTTARLHPDKGLDILIDAMALLRADGPAATLRILGGPQDGFEDLPAALAAQAERLGLSDAVELTGFVDRPEEHVARSRCYVQAARERSEILPLAILEAMAAGVPVVATDVGGVADIVRDDDTGLLVPTGDPAALAAAMQRVLCEPGLAERLRDNAFALAGERRFSEAGLIDGVLDAYERSADG